MPKDPNYVKLSRVDEIINKTYETYDELRSDLAGINTSIRNQAANISLDNEYDSYTTAAREKNKLLGVQSKFNKKRVYGIVVGNSSDPGKNVYVDVPLQNVDIVKGDDIFISDDVSYSNYQELIFYPNLSILQSTPQLGTICAVLIPDNYPEHVSSNPEDAIFLDVYSNKIVSPLDFTRPESVVIPGSLLDRINKLMAAGVGGGGSIGGINSTDCATSTGTPESTEEEKPKFFHEGKGFCLSGPGDSIKSTLAIFVGGNTYSDNRWMMARIPKTIKNTLWCLCVDNNYLNGLDKNKAQLVAHACYKQGGGTKNPNEIFKPNYIICGFEYGAGSVIRFASGTKSEETEEEGFKFIGLIQPRFNEGFKEELIKLYAPNASKIEFKEKTRLIASTEIDTEDLKTLQSNYSVIKTGIDVKYLEEIKIKPEELPGLFYNKYLSQLLGDDKSLLATTKSASDCISGIGADGSGGIINIPSTGNYSLERRNQIMQTLNRPDPNSLSPLSQQQILKAELSDLPRYATNMWLRINPQVPAVYNGLATIHSQNHSGITSILLKQIPPQYCNGTTDKFLYEEAVFSFIAMRIDLQNYIDTTFTTKGIVIPNNLIIAVSEAYRTYRRQEQMPKANAAPVGRSNHQAALAADVEGINIVLKGRNYIDGGSGKWQIPNGPIWEWMQSNAWRYGWRRTVPSEIWHWEYRNQWVGIEYHNNMNGSKGKIVANNVDKNLQYAKNVPFNLSNS